MLSPSWLLLLLSRVGIEIEVGFEVEVGAEVGVEARKRVLVAAAAVNAVAVDAGIL